MSSARCIAAFRTNSDVCSWTRLAARWMRSKVACSARSSMRFVFPAIGIPPFFLSQFCSQRPITLLYGKCTYRAGRGVRSTLGTILGPHVIRDGERPARLCTLCTVGFWPVTHAELGKCVTAIYWGSSGRRFKSCQPDQQKWVLTCDDGDLCRDGCVGVNRSGDHTQCRRRARWSRVGEFLRV